MESMLHKYGIPDDSLADAQAVSFPSASPRRIAGWLRGVVVACSVLSLLGVVPARAQSSGAMGSQTPVTLIQNKSRNIKLPHPYADATVGSPEIADIVPISDRQILIVGKAPGTTNVLLYDNEKHLMGVLDVRVKVDTAAIGSEVRNASGATGVQLGDVNGRVVLKGEGRDAPAIDRVVKSVANIGAGPPINAMKLNSPQQVMLQVRFVEAARSAARSLGIRWQAVINNRAAGVVGAQANSSILSKAGIIPGSPVGPGGIANVPGAAAGGLGTTNFIGVNQGVQSGATVLDVVTNSLTGANPTATIITQLINTSKMGLDMVLSALEDNGVIRRLAEPNLVALSGETAEFLAGGQFPVPVVQGSGGGSLFAPITIQWKEYGVRLNFTPTVLSDHIISLRLAPSVSDLDYANAVIISGTVVPALTIRQANTTVELREGQTFAIAGLIQNRTVKEIQQLPWLSSVPVLGPLFRSTDFAQQETELVALVTPQIVRPVAPGQARLKTPLDTTLSGNDVDTFLAGKLEVQKTPPDYVTQTGVEQPLQGGMAPGAPGEVPPALAPGDSIQSFFGTMFSGSNQPNSPASPEQ
jgi:pilus assembly protein CpaC